MGFADPETMRDGLSRVRAVDAATVGTITMDSFTRVGDYDAVRRAMATGEPLNGYPLLGHSVATTRNMLDGVLDADFPIQLRHGTPLPHKVLERMLDVGLTATEGGPVSYCLPYGRTSLVDAVSAWANACRHVGQQPGTHVESFGGCMLGQLCPPSLLIAITILEGLFFRQCGIESISLSYAQQTNLQQDVEALRTTRRLAADLLDDTDWHVVLYTYMGSFPRTPAGARGISRSSTAIALAGGADRMVVKTSAEAHQVPSIQDNVEALEAAQQHVRDLGGRAGVAHDVRESSELMAESMSLIEETMALSDDVGEAMRLAFVSGRLDLPFCLHPDNRNRSRPRIASDGRLVWASAGAMPLPAPSHTPRTGPDELLAMLGYNASWYDAPELAANPATPELTHDDQGQEPLAGPVER